MSENATTAAGGSDPLAAEIRTITVDDLQGALVDGVEDFKANPTHLLFVGIIYPIVGLLLARFTAQADLIPLLFPLVAGFALVGPFAAIGLYDLSHRREQGRSATWKHAFSAFRSPAIGSILALGAILMVILLVWLATARLIYQFTIGSAMPATMGSLLAQVFDTSGGWALILIGNAVGFAFAVVAFTLSVVSFPLLLDRNVGLVPAIQTSIKAVSKNPRVMAIWGAIVVGALILGSIPFLIGLALVMPILGHATWHLYRRLVVHSGTPIEP